MDRNTEHFREKITCDILNTRLMSPLLLGLVIIFNKSHFLHHSLILLKRNPSNNDYLLIGKHMIINNTNTNMTNNKCRYYDCCC